LKLIVVSIGAFFSLLDYCQLAASLQGGMRILVTGTPGTGKTTFSEALCSDLCTEHGAEWKHLEVSSLVKSEQWHEGRDDKFDSYILNEELLNKGLQSMLQIEEAGVPNGACECHFVVDFHSPEVLEMDFGVVVHLTCETHTLYDRLQQRGYSEAKLQENLACEIMGVVQEEIWGQFLGVEEGADEGSGGFPALQKLETLEETGGCSESEGFVERNGILYVKLLNDTVDLMKRNQAIVAAILRNRL
jgi:adenylate kinase